MLLGILENLSGYFFNAGIKQVSTYILLILVWSCGRAACSAPLRQKV